ncbi:MAG: signal recognition particle-docking protein FtsY, partial [Chloroflexota bacterium]|nr:signal recognition particle-docking protein FtsY [Chloroflexota bacterium]
RDGLGARLRAIFSAPSAGDATWDDLEEALVAADVGPTAAIEVVDAARRRVAGTTTEATIRSALRAELIDRLTPPHATGFDVAGTPGVVLVVGVNGSGKTTTLAKLAARLRAGGRSVILAAGDTFRAAAIEQLRLWGERLAVPVVAQRHGADPGAVAFDAVTAAESRGIDIVLVDTAGRLQNRRQLMDELAKIRRVVERRVAGQPAHVLLVLDATTGQNGLAQAEGFSRDAGVTGVVLTKLDGSAKGGVVVAIVDRLAVPVFFVGTGESIDDLAPFEPDAYVDWLLDAA